VHHQKQQRHSAKEASVCHQIDSHIITCLSITQTHQSPLISLPSVCPAGESKSTQYSVSTDAHVWNCSLTWRISKDELRKAQASGSSHCKLTVLRKDGSKLGWAVVSLRSAKLQSQYKSDPQGM
jgi:hypothetical protein